jgi:hypothetical protein
MTRTKPILRFGSEQTRSYASRTRPLTVAYERQTDHHVANSEPKYNFFNASVSTVSGLFNSLFIQSSSVDINIISSFIHITCSLSVSHS